jgi:type IV pilus modification protein PilV
MKPLSQRSVRQHGVMLIEALMAILIFSLGILGLVGVHAMALGSQSDAQFRSEANRLTNRIANEMWVNVDRSSPAALALSLAEFKHRADVSACDAGSEGAASDNLLVKNWVAAIVAGGAGGLPGATHRMQQIVVDPGAGNQVTVTVCWRAPSDIAMRRHVLTTYIQ